jgi:hypothetical protein
MKELIKQNIKDEAYLETLFERIVIQRNSALDNISVLETELLKLNSILKQLSEENNELKEKLDSEKKED